jgi:hypothetical protein
VKQRWLDIDQIQKKKVLMRASNLDDLTRSGMSWKVGQENFLKIVWAEFSSDLMNLSFSSMIFFLFGSFLSF